MAKASPFTVEAYSAGMAVLYLNKYLRHPTATECRCVLAQHQVEGGIEFKMGNFDSVRNPPIHTTALFQQIFGD